MLKDEAGIDLDVDALRAALGAMAAEGEIAPFLAVFHAQVIKAFSVKDTRRLDEKTIKLLFMMYASLGRAFHPLSEKEFAQGYCDLFLGASKNVAGARFSWLLEFKYLKAGATEASINVAFEEAQEQVERYASDAALLPILLDQRELRAGMIVFVGTKKVLFRPWPPAPPAKLPKARRKAPKCGRS
jgi:PD-(D/E)XK nuclease superfamily protein